MRNYVIINGVNSLTIQGLAIKTLPPITKPIQRNLREEIDGRDGDIVTTLGYGAYDKTIEIGLFGTFDIDEVIAYFNQKGTITFSNEADKVYYFEALDQVDYAELLKFRTANVVLHCQPFKYPVTETPLVEEYEYVEATGSNVTLDNTSEAIFNKIELQGNTSQQTYTGKNKLKYAYPLGYSTTINGVTWTINQDGTITANGTASSLSFFTFATGTEINDLIGQSVSFNGTPIGTDSDIFLGVYNQDWSPVKNVQAGQDQTFTMPSTATRVLARVGNGKTANNIVFKPMIRLSNVTDTTYEPYVGGIPSPNPNYPQDIHVVSGDNVVEITGRNLIDEAHKTNKWVNQNGAVVTATGSNCIKIECQAGDKISTFATFATASATGIIVVAFYDENDNLLQRNVRVNGTELTITGTAPANTSYAYAGHHTDAPTQIQVQRGEPTEYEPFTSQSFPINLGDLEMASIPNTDYKDAFVKEGETWYKRAMLKKVIYDGTETGWGMSTWGTQPYKRMSRDVADIKQIADSEISPIISNQFRAGRYNDGSLNTITSRGSIHQLNLWQDVATANVSAWTTWLSNHNLIVYYPLAEETDIEITNETLIDQLEAIKNAISYKGQTNISQTNNDMPFVLDLSALKENSDHLVIDNIGNIYSKPTLDLEGTGIVDIYLNDSQMFEVDLSEKNEIVIDTEKMEAYNPTDNTLANRQVTGDYSKFKLDSGENDLRFSGDLSKATITRYERWL